MCACACVCSVAQFCQSLVTPWTVACQAPLSMGLFPRQEYWSGLLFPPPGDLLEPRDQTCISCTSRWILNQCATWEAPYKL